MSRNSLLETGAISEVQMTAMGFKPTINMAGVYIDKLDEIVDKHIS